MGLNYFEVWVDDEKDSGFNTEQEAVSRARSIARSEEDAKKIQVWDTRRNPKVKRIEWREQTGMHSVGGKWRPTFKGRAERTYRL